MPTYTTVRTIRPGSAEEVKRIIAELPEGQSLQRTQARLDTYNVVQETPDPERPRDLYDIWHTENREATSEELAELEAAQKAAHVALKDLQAEARAMPQAVQDAIAVSDAVALTALSNRKATIGAETLLAELRFQEARIRHMFAKASYQRAEEVRSRSRCYQPTATTDKAAAEQREACARYHSLRGGAGYGIGDVRRRIEAIRAELGR